MILLNQELSRIGCAEIMYVSEKLVLQPGFSVTITPPANQYVRFTLITPNSPTFPTTFTVSKTQGPDTLTTTFTGNMETPMVGRFLNDRLDVAPLEEYCSSVPVTLHVTNNPNGAGIFYKYTFIKAT